MPTINRLPANAMPIEKKQPQPNSTSPAAGAITQINPEPHDQAIVKEVVSNETTDPVSEKVNSAFKQLEGQSVGTSSYPMGLLSQEVKLGQLEGVHDTMKQAIDAARVDDGAEIIYKHSVNGQTKYGVFHVKEFEQLGKSFKLDKKIEGFYVVEEDDIAEQKAKELQDTGKAIHQANEALKTKWFAPDIRQYDASGEKDVPFQNFESTGLF